MRTRPQLNTFEVNGGLQDRDWEEVLDAEQDQL